MQGHSNNTSLILSYTTNQHLHCKNATGDNDREKVLIPRIKIKHKDEQFIEFIESPTYSAVLFLSCGPSSTCFVNSILQWMSTVESILSTGIFQICMSLFVSTLLNLANSSRIWTIQRCWLIYIYIYVHMTQQFSLKYVVFE